MDNTLKSNLNKYMKQVDFYLQLPNRFNQGQLSFKYNEREWSLLELLEHLYQVEKATLSFMKHFDFNRKNQVLGFKESFRYLVLHISLLIPIQFKVPQIPSLNPEHKHIDKDQLSKEWSRLRDELSDFVSNFPAEKRHHFIFNHPMVGKLNIAQTLGFLNSHAQHHRRQVKKIEGFAGFPKN